MSRRIDQTMVAVQVETAHTSVWQQDGITHGTHPSTAVPLTKLLALPPGMGLTPVSSPFSGLGVVAVQESGQSKYTTAVETDRTADGLEVVTAVQVNESSSQSMGPTILQTKIPTPVTPGDQVNFSGTFAVRRTGHDGLNGIRDSNNTRTGVNIRVTVWGIGPQPEDEYGDADDTVVALLNYTAALQGTGNFTGTGVQHVSFTIPTVSAATVPAGVTRVHLTVALTAQTNGGFLSTTFNGTYATVAAPRNLITLSNANPLRLTVIPAAPPTPQPPAATWETLTQEQTRVWRYTYQDVTDDVVRVATERIEADLGVTTIRFVSDTAPQVATAGKRMRVLALHPDGTFTTIAAGTLRTRRIIHDGRHKTQLEVGVHDCHHRIASTRCGVAFDTFAEYIPILNSTGVDVRVDGVDYTGPSRPLPEWGGAFPSFTEEDLSVFESLIMARNTRKGFLRITRRDTVELRQTLPSTVALDLSDVPGQGHMSYAVNIEFGSDTADLINEVSVQENCIDADTMDRQLSSDDPPTKLEYLDSTSRTATYRRDDSVDTYGLSRISFPVVRGTGNWSDIQAGNYGSGFRAWATAILDEYATERTGPKSITLFVTTAAHRRLVAALEVLDAVVVRFQGQAQVRRIRRITHNVQPGRWTVDLRFDVTSDQVYWLPATPVPAATTQPPAPTEPYTPNLDAWLEPATVGGEGGDIDPALSSSLDGGNP